MKSAGRSDVGPKRSRNFDEHRINEALGLYLVAHGYSMVAKDGTSASTLAVETVLTHIKSAANEPPTWPFPVSKAKNFHTTQLRLAFKLAEQVVSKRAANDSINDDLQWFGAYLVALWVTKSAAIIAHIGDCRVYRIRAGKMEQLTTDHSLLQDYMKMKPMTPEEIESFPHKNVIVRSLGSGKDPLVDIITEPLEQDDLYLLCTGGLHGSLQDKEMLRVIESAETLDAACAALISESAVQNPNGGNCTAVLVRVDAAAPQVNTIG